MKVNPFPYPTPLQEHLLKRVCAVAYKAEHLGWAVATAGNFSVRGSGQLCWMSPSGVDKGQLQPQQFIAVDLATGKNLGPLYRKPSDETALHLAIYRNFQAAKTIIHVHPPFLSRLKSKTEIVGKEMIKAMGLPSHESVLKLRIEENTQDMDDLARRVPQIVASSDNHLILKHHGIYVWSSSPEQALHRVHALEYLVASIDS